MAVDASTLRFNLGRTQARRRDEKGGDGKRGREDSFEKCPAGRVPLILFRAIYTSRTLGSKGVSPPSGSRLSLIVGAAYT